MESRAQAILPVRRARSARLATGQVAEWLKAPVLKTGGPSRVSWVRIPPCPFPLHDRRLGAGLGRVAMEAEPSLEYSARDHFRELVGQRAGTVVQRRLRLVPHGLVAHHL